MDMLASPSVVYPTLMQLSDAVYRASQALRDVARRFNERWEARARSAVALRELNALSDRDLNDIGLSRCDIRRIAGKDSNGPL